MRRATPEGGTLSPPPGPEGGGDGAGDPGPAAPAARSALSVIRMIKEGSIAAASLSVADRQRCVAHLLGEGYSVAEIAEILSTCERTIQRDKAALRREAAIRHDPELAGQVAGQLVAQAEATMTALSRLARDSQSPPAVRVEALKARWTVFHQLTERLQSMGLIPTAPQRVQADLTHRAAPPDPVALAAEVEHLRRLTQEVGGGGAAPALEPAFRELSLTLARLDVVEAGRRATDGGAHPRQDVHDQPPDPPDPAHAPGSSDSSDAAEPGREPAVPVPESAAPGVPGADTSVR